MPILNEGGSLPRPESDPQTKQLIGQRAAKPAWSSQFVGLWPQLASQLLTSGMAEEKVAALPKHVTAASNYVDVQYTFAGQTGALTAAYTKARAIADPVARKQAVSSLKALQALSPDEQSSFMVMLGGLEHPANVPVDQSALGSALGVAPEDVQVQTAGFSRASQPGAPVPGSITGITVPLETSTAKVQQIEAAFPQLAGKIHFEGGNGPAGLTFRNILDSAENYSSEYRMNFGLDPNMTYSQQVEKQGFGKTYGDISLGTTESVISAPVTAAAPIVRPVASAAGTAEGNFENWAQRSTLPGAHGALKVTSAGISGTTAFNRINQNFMQDATGAIGTMLLPQFWGQLIAHPTSTALQKNTALLGSKNIDWKTGTGALSSDPNAGIITNNTRYINAAGSIGMMVLLHEATEAGGAYGEVRTTPTDLLKAQEAARNAAIDDQSLAAKLFHPVRSFIDPITRARIIDTFGKTTREWQAETEAAAEKGDASFIHFLYRSTPSNSFFDMVERVKNDPSITDKVGALYGMGGGEGMSRPILEGLLDEPRLLMPRYAADAMSGSTDAEITSVAVDLAARNADHNEAAQALNDAQGSSGLPLEGQTFDVPAKDLVPLTEFPGRTAISPEGTMRGRTAESTAALVQSMAERGYDPNYVPEGGSAGGNIVLEYDPTTELGIIREGHHRIGVQAASDAKVPVEVKIVESMPPTAGADIAENGGIEPGLKGLSEISNQNLEPVGQPLPEDLKAKIDEALAQAPAPAGPDVLSAQAAYDQTQADLVAAQARANALRVRDPEQLFFPGANYDSASQFFHRAILSGHPHGFFEQIAQLLAPVKTLERFSNDIFGTHFSADASGGIAASLVNKMDSRPFLYNPMSEDYNSVKADVNATTIRRYGQRLGMTPTDIEGVIQRFLQSKDPSSVFQALKFFADRRLKYAPADMGDAARKELGRAVPSDFYQGYNTVDTTLEDGHVITEPVSSSGDVNGTARQRPFLPSEFLSRDKLYLPDLRVVDEATNFLKRWEQNASKTRRIVGQTYGWARVALQLAGRTTALPLWALFKLPALIVKHTVDPIIGNLATPGMISGARAPDVMLNTYEALGHPGPDVLGSVNEGLTDRPNAMTVPIPTAQYIDSGALSVEGAQAFLDKMDYYANDPLARTLMRNDFDVEKTAQQLEGGDINLARFHDTQLSQFGHSPEELRALLDRQSRAIQQAALGSPEHLDMMRYGRFSSGRFVGHEYPDQIAQDIEDIRARLDELDRETDQGAIRELQRQLVAKIDEGMANPETTTYPITMDDRNFLAKDLQDRFDNNELQLPKQIQVQRYGQSFYRDANGDLQTSYGSALEQAREVNAKLSKLTYRVFQPVGWADRTIGRTNFFVSQGYDFYAKYKALGMSDADAEAAATMQASLKTKDFFYDLTTRSSAERASRDLFWFAPAGGELMYRWFYRIPGESGNALLGNLLNYAKFENYLNLAKAIGAVRTNSAGRDYIPVGGATHFLSTVSGGHWKYSDQETLGIPLTSLDPLVTQPLPTMGPIPAKALTELAKHIGALRGLANVLAPYGNTGNYLPYTMRRLAGAFGIKVPDLMNNDVVDAQYKRQMITGAQLALLDAKKNDPQPTLAQFNLDPGAKGYIPVTDDAAHTAAKQKYDAAMKAWTDRVFSDATHISMGISAASTLFGDVLPGSVIVSTPQTEDWAKFLQSTSGMTAAQFSYAEKQYLSGHPQDFPLSVTKGLYTGIPVPKGEDPMKLYLDGYKQYMDAHQFIDFAGAMQSKFLYDQRSYAETRGFSKTAPDVLRNWSAHSVSLSNRDNAYQAYLLANPDAAAIVATHDAKVAEAYPSYGVRSDEATYLKTTMQGMQSLSALFTDGAPIPTSEFSTVLSTLKTARAQLYSQYAKAPGVKPDAVTAGLNWYFDGPINDYMKAATPIWNEINARSAASIPASDLYLKLQQLDSQYAHITHGGQSYPSPSEFFYDAKTPAQQAVTKAHWAGEPASFLTPFAQQLVGYKLFPGEDAMWQAIGANDARVSAVLHTASPGSSQYDAIKTWGQNTDTAIAGKYGAAGIQAYQTSIAAPYVRLQALGTFKNDTVMQQAFQYATVVTAEIKASGGSPGGSTSPAEIAAKVSFYSWLRSQSDPQFTHDMSLLSLGLHNAPGGRSPSGADLYEAIFFNQFQPAYIGYQVRVAAAA